MLQLGLKVAVAGKGGVGKTTIAGSLARVWARDSMKVLAVDADPASHLHSVLEIPENSMPTPISSELDLIEERTGARPGTKTGPFFKLNPKVEDIPARYSVVGADGVRLLILGTIKEPGSGCFCPENSLLRGLLEHIVLERDDAVIVDMEAGLEQFGRATCRGVDLMIVIVEPGLKSVETATRIIDLAKAMGVPRTALVANRIRTPEESEAVSRMLRSRGMDLDFVLPYSKAVSEADLVGGSVFQARGADEWESAIRRLSKEISTISKRKGK